LSKLVKGFFIVYDFPIFKIKQILVADGPRGAACIVLNFVKITQTVFEIWQFFVFFQDGGRPPSWIFKIAKFY